MIVTRRGEDRGRTQTDWLDSRHTFSFGEYYDPRHMGFRDLRVINEDRVAPGRGFGTHGHRDMEILSYVLRGALSHTDSTGGGGVIRPGDVQRMTAGRGVRHSEQNHSTTEPVHFLQIWILPEEEGLEPGYEQRTFALDEGLTLVASRDGQGGSVTVHQDVRLWAGGLAPEERVSRELARGRHAWLQVARGDVALNGTALRAGDGAAISGEERVEIAATTPAEVLLFDLA